MALVNLNQILLKAKKEKYGVPCLLGGNLEMVTGQIRAAEEMNSPLILFFNQPITSRIPMELGLPMNVNAAQRAKVPVAVILDHGTSLDFIIKAINLKTSSVMFDGSRLPYEENVRQTKEIVRIAHAIGISVEAELGCVGGNSVELGGARQEDIYTDVAQAEDFVHRTGIDALAISFGNTHGVYQGKPRLDLELVKSISSRVEVPLVMHGASGLKDEDYRKIIASGITKFNYYTFMARSVSAKIRDKIAAAGEDVIYHNIINWAVDFFYEETKKLIAVMGSAGQA